MTSTQIKQYISYLLIGLILTFAVTSVGNVSEFVHMYHAGWTGLTLGICFGVTLFVSAYIAATAKQKQTRQYALAVGLVFGVASAGFQTVLYIAGGAVWYVAFPLAFVPIVGGEVGLALVESSYSDEREHEVDLLRSTKLESALATLRTESKTQVESLSNQLETARNEANSLRNSLESLRNQVDTWRNEAENAKTQVESLSNQLETARRSDGIRVIELEKQLEELKAEFGARAMLERLSGKVKEQFEEVVTTVHGERIMNAADFAKVSSLGKTKAYEVFSLASGAGIIYPNGDGAYHVRN